MNKKDSRITAIKRIIKSTSIDCQEKLLTLLKDEGYDVTQATLSRDLKNMGVSKVADGKNGYHYDIPNAEQQKETKLSFYKDIERGFISLEFSDNIGVLKTLPGHANSVAFAIDNVNFEEILGTMAGDDTILIVLREKAKKEKLIELFKIIVPDMEI